MRLVLSQYLASLREREELDALLPDLLSEMGLTIISRPQRGTRQYGVDIAAVGSLDSGEEKIYLLSVKSGNLSRRDWDVGPQALRPSLTEIIEFYIGTHIAPEHKDKHVVICLCVGGSVGEDVRPLVTAYQQKHETENVSFEEWHGDRIATYIERHLLGANLLPDTARSNLRKTLALLDEPETAYKHFQALLGQLLPGSKARKKKRITAVRQICLCTWIVYAWARDCGNLEAAYRAGELALLSTWDVCRPKSKTAAPARPEAAAFDSIYDCYTRIAGDYVDTYVAPHASTYLRLSTATRGSCGLDVNKKLFDIIGRISMRAMWEWWRAMILTASDEEDKQAAGRAMHESQLLIQRVISNNPTCLMPALDTHSIEVTLAMIVLSVHPQGRAFAADWIQAIADRVRYSFIADTAYPTTHRTYEQQVLHYLGQKEDTVGSGRQASTLVPALLVWTAVLDQQGAFALLSDTCLKTIPDCTLQFWNATSTSEDCLSTGVPRGATTLCPSPDNTPQKFLKEVLDGIVEGREFKTLSFIKFGFWPLLLVAARHHRFPVPIALWKDVIINGPGQG